MPSPPHPIHPVPPFAPHECAQLERLRGESANAVTALAGRVHELASQIEDLRVGLAEIPHEVSARIASERTEREKRLDKGENLFNQIFKDLAANEKRVDQIKVSVLLMWLLLGLIGGIKVLALFFPIFGKLL